jgi:hypothetical protein
MNYIFIKNNLKNQVSTIILLLFIQKIWNLSKNLDSKNFKFQQKKIRKSKNGHFWYVHFSKSGGFMLKTGFFRVI